MTLATIRFMANHQYYISLHEPCGDINKQGKLHNYMLHEKAPENIHIHGVLTLFFTMQIIYSQKVCKHLHFSTILDVLGSIERTEHHEKLCTQQTCKIGYMNENGNEIQLPKPC